MTAWQTAEGLEQLFHRQFLFNRALDQIKGISGNNRPRVRTMTALCNDGACTLKELSERVKASPSNLCLLLKSLCEEGLTTRSAHPSDRRVVIYEATDQGRSWLQAQRQERARVISSYLEGYPQERLDALYAHADRLAQDLEQLTADIDRKLK